jgi:hypothetical protein
LLNYLPSELTNLPLISLSVHPNPFRPSPCETEAGSRCFGEVTVYHAGIPPLRELALRRLIRPMEANEERCTLEEIYALPLPSSEVSGIPEELWASLNPTPAAFRNPSHSECPSPLHKQRDEPTSLFIDPILERFEWINRIGEHPISPPRVPIRWRGCSTGCLNFLEDDGRVKERGKKNDVQVAGLGPNGERFEFSDEE